MVPNSKDNFLLNRWKSIGYALRGFIVLLRTESAVQIHFFTAVTFVLFGFICGLSAISWAIQFIIFGLILAVESLNTAIEKICDFIHPDFHDKIGLIKDISAGAVTFAVIFGYIALSFIYLSLI